ncbi:epimerase [Kluyvera cryocrescens]|uniref:epimerase n=1 Tax=Kluyvera cryocrescens TaxID=580 RepID=UPI0028BEF63E|nr:epimerase [Kluyvera cryocrescens]WNN73830.1 epimerase [Kluyvera cryocrescens]
MNRPFSGLNRSECVSLMKRYPLSIGILAGQWLKLGEYQQNLHSLEQPVLHLDLMDGHFCPQFTVGPWAIAQLPQQMIKDVYLMVDNPWPVVQASVKAGAHCVTLQVENMPHLHHMLHWLGEQNAAVSGGTMPLLRGISLCPATPLEHILPVIEDVEIVQILAVTPGYGSKLCRSALLSRITQVVALLNAVGKRDAILLAVDGSLNLEELPEIIASGVDRVVSGSALFRNDALSDNVSRWLTTIQSAR